MKKIFTLGILLASAISFSQEKPFTKKVDEISVQIEKIVKENKKLLKEDLQKIDDLVEHNEITKEHADSLREERSRFYSKEIETQSVVQEDAIRSLINEKIDDVLSEAKKINPEDLIEKRNKAFISYEIGHSSLLLENTTYADPFHSKMINSFGLQIGGKTRLSKDFSRWHTKYHLGILFNSFRINHNNILINENSSTQLAQYSIPLERSRFMVTNITLNAFIEYDFGKQKRDEDGNLKWASRTSAILGIGGFLGYNELGQQYRYRIDGEKYDHNVNSRYNINHFNYGISGYIGYRDVRITASYNLNTLFKRSFADMNLLNISFVFDIY